MIQIRNNIFETNSSSTHCLVISNQKLNFEIDESLFLKKYEVFAGKSEKIRKDIDGEKFIKIQDKLTYLVKILLMCLHEGDEDEWCELDNKPAYKLLNLLKEIFPNTDFSAVTYEKYDYYYEDGEYLCDDWGEEAPIEKLLDKDILKRFFQYGEAYFGNRDDEAYFDFLFDNFNNSDYLLVECSG